MSHRVAPYLARGRSKPHSVSALDAVMGEDWAVVEPGRPRRGRAPGAAHAADVSRGPAGGMVPGRRPQAVVKMVRGGGASDLRGLGAQMAYLSRGGAEPLRRSEAFMGVEVDAGQAASIARGWRMPPEGSGRAGRTSHFIVSVPEDAPRAAAERAGRAWAEAMIRTLDEMAVMADGLVAYARGQGDGEAATGVDSPRFSDGSAPSGARRSGR